MTRTELQLASEHIAAAADATADDETKERLQRQAEEFEKHAEADRGPDHGRLARHENILHDVADDADEAVVTEIQTALDHIRKFRETLPGV